MYSSAVYPRTFSSVWFAQRTVPSEFSQCIAMGAFWKKSISSASRALCVERYVMRYGGDVC